MSLEHRVETDAAMSAPARTGATALVVLAGLACVFALHWAAALFVPLLMGMMISYALTPLVNRMVRWRLPRSVSAALLLSGIVGAIGSAGYTLSDDAASMINALPGAAQKLRRSLEEQRDGGPNGAIEKMQKAAAEIERAAQEPTGPPPARGVVKVQVEKSRFNVKDYLWPGALGLVAALGQAAVIVFVAFFLLASGDTFRRKMVKIAGPTLGHKKLTVIALDEINDQIQRYLQIQVFTSALVGAATWLSFLWIGVENAAVWGVATFLLNFIPYLGSSIVTGGSALLGFVQFGSFEMAGLIGAVALVINSIEGYILTPWLTGRASRMNPVAIFIGVIAWGWLWGVWGLFLGVPMLLAMKSVCDRVDGLKPIGALLGE
ncbi:MAG: AI-2E family transporter [Burkholderiaceae bacterium]|nr:AI-2E family transporter [Burkholderiaceae bacterium]MBP7659748.1 AI-2E family transporter [Burkholderiaceae bacterium]